MPTTLDAPTRELLDAAADELRAVSEEIRLRAEASDLSDTEYALRRADRLEGIAAHLSRIANGNVWMTVATADGKTVKVSARGGA